MVFLRLTEGEGIRRTSCPRGRGSKTPGMMDVHSALLPGLQGPRRPRAVLGQLHACACMCRGPRNPGAEFQSHLCLGRAWGRPCCVCGGTGEPPGRPSAEAGLGKEQEARGGGRYSTRTPAGPRGFCASHTREGCSAQHARPCRDAGRCTGVVP